MEAGGNKVAGFPLEAEMDYELIAAGRENISPWSQGVNKSILGVLTNVVILAANPPVQIIVKRLHINILTHDIPAPKVAGFQLRLDNSDGVPLYQEDGWIGNTLTEGGVQQIYTSERNFNPGIRLVQGKGLTLRIIGGTASLACVFNVSVDGFIAINYQFPASPQIIF